MNYTYQSCCDNQSLPWAVPPIVGQSIYVKLEGESSCGETDVDFYTLTALCSGGNWLVSNDNGTNGLFAYPNPINNGNLTFDFMVTEKCNVNYQFLDINGAVVKSENLGKLAKGKYTYRTTIPHSSSNVLLLKLVKGKDIETTKILNYE